MVRVETLFLFHLGFGLGAAVFTARRFVTVFAFRRIRFTNMKLFWFTQIATPTLFLFWLKTITDALVRIYEITVLFMPVLNANTFRARELLDSRWQGISLTSEVITAYFTNKLGVVSFIITGFAFWLLAGFIVFLH
jgi:hypothetical protein